MTSTSIRELRDRTGETQREFAERYHIPLSTLKKWEQGSASPPPYVLRLIAETIPTEEKFLQKLSGENGETYYYNPQQHAFLDRFGTSIRAEGDPSRVNPHNLQLYLHDLFTAYYEAVERFERDCRLDEEEKILWS